MKFLPQITLNGNLQTWIAFFLFLATIVGTSATAGSWLSARLSDIQSGKEAAQAAHSLSESMEKLSQRLEEQSVHTEELAEHMVSLNLSVEELKRSNDRLNKRVTTDVASKTWIKSLVHDAEKTHEDYEKRIRELEKKRGGRG